ncbi:site-2 protease family protein [Turicimonas muris]|uniref:site-2 protease family protein n=1 Tax=Turicimonas muris TaxID=1796652 RepID=UPI00249438A6|nr:site-2 protease family protein [Turicimonas muris]
MDINSIIQTITVYAIPLILAITIHEAAHGYVARYFGDQTAWMLGRVTLNPMKHIDPVGTIFVPAVMLLGSAVSGLGGIVFGWAKPVPVNFRNLRNPKQAMIWVAAAGPGANLLQAIIWAILLKVIYSVGLTENYFYEVCLAGINVNIMLMALNLIPILPLDGGRILTGLLPPGLAYKYSRIEPYGMYILFVLILTGMLSIVMKPFMHFGLSIVKAFL